MPGVELVVQDNTPAREAHIDRALGTLDGMTHLPILSSREGSRSPPTRHRLAEIREHLSQESGHGPRSVWSGQRSVLRKLLYPDHEDKRLTGLIRRLHFPTAFSGEGQSGRDEAGASVAR